MYLSRAIRSCEMRKNNNTIDSTSNLEKIICMIRKKSKITNKGKRKLFQKNQNNMKIIER